ncbi:MAG: 50S ribosomal protein L30 [Thermoprotei archaeon]|nr:MAG: 50S ribosomal protein L30 [Thermoprotei archaeon]RLE82723.1 MAG: 50S ribosomal protein L30 [Thermoprotei archaeon]RLF03573.1 MAG: 50S ribosomal protein L30 [Thermoprotei archaeon]
MKLAVIRIRGCVGVPEDVEYTLKLLRLHKKFNVVLVDDTPSIRGMLHKVKDYVTWGEIDRDTLTLLLKYRGRVVGGDRLREKHLKKLGFSSFEELADAILEGHVDLRKEPFIKPVFRLHPPKGGFRYSIKKHYGNQGELGYRGSDINNLLKRMI